MIVVGALLVRDGVLKRVLLDVLLLVQQQIVMFVIN